MAKVFIIGMMLLIIVGIIALAIFLIGGAAKLTSLFWRKKRHEDK